MTVLAHPRHERFAQELSKGKTADEAYALAGYNPHRSNAARLSANEHIQSRIAELQDRGAMRAEVTIEGLIDEAHRIGSAAFQAKQFSAAVAALKEKAVLSGLRVDRAENRNINYEISAEPLSEDEWEKRYCTEN